MSADTVIVPIHLGQWDELLEEQQAATFFHTSAWLMVLAKTYGYTPLSVLRREAGKSVPVLPLMEVRSIITGNRGVALPFTDLCEPLFAPTDSMDEIVALLKNYGRERQWDYFEIRGGGEADQTSAFYYSHILDLSPGMQKIASGLRESTARNISKAGKAGVTVAVGDSAQLLQQFVRLNYLTRREHGLPPQPALFFRKVHEYIHAKGMGITVIASHANRPIAGAVYFHYRDRAVYKFGAFDRTYQHLRANNLVMWEAVNWYAGRGYKEISFGRTEPENEGLLQFKRGWGAQEGRISYCRYDLRNGRFVQDAPPHRTAYKRLFARTPVAVLRAVGSVFYRHAG